MPLTRTLFTHRPHAGPIETNMDMLSDDAITNVSVKRLQKMMDTAEYTEAEQERVRLQRRKIQNRNSAKASANRKTKQLTAVITSNTHLNHIIEDLKNRNIELERRLAEADQVRGQAVDRAERSMHMHYQRELGHMAALLDRSKRNSGACHAGPPVAAGASRGHCGLGSASVKMEPNACVEMKPVAVPQLLAFPAIRKPLEVPTLFASPPTDEGSDAFTRTPPWTVQDGAKFDKDFHAFNHESHPFDNLDSSL
jgi:hypothetical protein